MYSILQDPCDKNLTILRDNKTGMYSATKAIHAYYDTHKCEKKKQPSQWFELDSTKSLIEMIKQEYHIHDDEVKISVRGGNDPKKRGTWYWILL